MEQTVTEERQTRVTLREPSGGWSWHGVQQELDAYVTARGRSPQTITMHPETLAALRAGGDFSDGVADKDEPTIVTSRDYDQSTITLYY